MISRRSLPTTRLRRANRSSIRFDRQPNPQHARGHITALSIGIHASTDCRAITAPILGLASAPSRLSLRSTRGRGLAALTGPRSSPKGHLRDGPASVVWAAMEEITLPDAADQISIARCRELLGDEAVDLSDEEVDRVRQHADALAHVLVEIILENRTTAE